MSIHAPKKQGATLNGDSGWPPAGPSRVDVISSIRHDRDVDMEDVGMMEVEADFGRVGNDDTDNMEWEQTAHQSTNGLAYLAVDTNILINQLASVKALHDRLIQHWPPSLLFLVPNTVINELDRHSSSKVPVTPTAPPLPRGISIHSPAAKQYQSSQTKPTTLGNLAREATAWLLKVGQQRRERGWGLVRCQQWAERTQKDLTKADDKILDCCIYFAKHDEDYRAAVWLWTDDRNLKVQAEAHDIPTIGNSSLTPDAILAKCSPDHPARGSKQIGTTPDGIYSNGETMVELDKETQPDNTSLHRYPRSQINANHPGKAVQGFARRLPASANRDVALLSAPLWSKVLIPGEEGPICVACAPTIGGRSKSFTAVWADVKENTDETAIWLWNDVLDMTGTGTLTIERHEPLSLTTVFLQPASLDQELPDLDDLLSPFPPLIFRQGGSLSCKSGSFNVLMAEPVLQGCITKETQVIFAKAAPAKSDNYIELAMNGDFEASSATSRLSLADFDPDAFLSSSLALPAPSTGTDGGLAESSHSASSDFDSQSGSITPRPGDASPPAAIKTLDVNGDLGDGLKGASVEFTGIAASSRLAASEEAGDAKPDSDASCWLSVAGLGRAGVFPGDWVLLENGSERPASRLALVNVLRDPISSLASEESADRIVLPPLILSALSNSAASDIHLRPTPFGSRLPELPVAHSITLARIASAESVDRKFEASWVNGLRNYFLNPAGGPTRRLVRRGDIIGVPVIESSSEVDDGDDDILDVTDAASSVVFFVITAMSYEPLIPLESDFSSSLSSRARAGEFGCWVDGAQTRMVQLGVERAMSCKGNLGWWGVDDIPRPFSSSASAKMKELMASALSPAAQMYALNIAVIVKGACGSGKASLVRSAARELGFHLVEADCFSIVGDTDAVTEGTLQAIADKAVSCAPCVVLLKHIEALARKSESMASGQEPAIASGLRDAISKINTGVQQAGWPVIVVGTTSDEDKVPAEMLANFKQQVTIKAPSESERLSILQTVFGSVTLGPDVSLKALAVQTAALQAGDFVNLGAKAQECSLSRVSQMIDDSASWTDVYRSGVAVSAADIEKALQLARLAYSDSIGAPKIPNVTWDDVGGLASVKSDILDTIQLPLEHPELFADGLKKRSGILLYGPPGTGKTLLAKAVATSCSLNFFSVKGPELLNMYIGESEANVRRVFQRARDAKPCVIFMDELDSVAPKRGNQGDSGGVMDRIVSQLLAELDGMSDGGDGDGVYVMAATNRPDLLDPALLRPGRFDRMLYLGVSDTHDAQLKIMQALTRKFKLDSDVDLAALAIACPFNYTGADFYALCSDALLKAMARKAEEVDTKIAGMNAAPSSTHPNPMTPQYYLSALATPAEIEVLVSQQDFERALDELVPSVSQGEMEHYREVQKMFSRETINGT